MKVLLLADASSPHTDRWIRGLESIGHQLTLASFQEPWEPGRKIIRLQG
ncbi:MAG: glycosyltransferase, partial [Candidatus Hydrothermia bacterium]